MFAVTPGQLGPELRALAARLPDVRAVLMVSAHWQTRGVRVMTTAKPATIHDFGGFPSDLYRIRYACDGAPALADTAAGLLAAAGFEVEADDARGFDHGAWVPMRHLWPEANMPMFQVSMPIDLDTRGALRLGAALAPLREQGVLIVGSGSLTHNLYEFQQHIRDPEYAQHFAAWVRDAAIGRDTDALTNYRSLAPHAVRAHPTEEHFLPLMVALGAAGEDAIAQLVPGGMTYGVLSMDSFVWDAPGASPDARNPIQ